MGQIRPEIEQTVRAACDSGDYDAATAAAIRGYGPEVMGFLSGRLQDDTAAGDAFALFCEDVWRGLPKFQWRSSFRVWAYTVARNASNRYGRLVLKPGQRNVGLSKAEHLVGVIDQVRTATAQHLRTETKTKVQKLRERLSVEDRTVLILRVDRGMEWEELASVLADDDQPLAGEALKKESARLRKRFQLAKQRLRKLAEEEGMLG